MEHLKYLAWFNYAFAAITAFVTFLVFLGALGGIASIAMAPEMDVTTLVIMGVSFGFALLLCAVLTIVYAMAGRRVSRGRGRILQTILSILAVGNFPVGTLYGVYGLWVCWMNEDTKKVFDEPYGLID